MPRKSQRVGPATDGDGARTMAYRACVPLVCVQCKGAILPDQLFSRRSTLATWGAVGTGTTEPVCMTCRPLRLEGATNAPSPTDDERRERRDDGPMGQSMGSERERDTQQQRADARERVHVAQEREASARAVRQSDARQRAAQRQQLATQEARKPLVTDETPQPDVPDASGDEVTT